MAAGKLNAHESPKFVTIRGARMRDSGCRRAGKRAGINRRRLRVRWDAGLVLLRNGMRFAIFELHINTDAHAQRGFVAAQGNVGCISWGVGTIRWDYFAVVEIYVMFTIIMDSDEVVNISL